MFLEHDGLNANWETGAQSDWQGELVNLRNEDEQDYSGMGLGNDAVYANNTNDPDELEPDNIQLYYPNATAVCNCNSIIFKHKLVEHYDILFQKRKVHWPKRTGMEEIILTN
jgi:hypothetical protein